MGRTYAPQAEAWLNPYLVFAESLEDVLAAAKAQGIVKTRVTWADTAEAVAGAAENSQLWVLDSFKDFDPDLKIEVVAATLERWPDFMDFSRGTVSYPYPPRLP